MDDVGLEPGSIISELGGFPVKEMKFRKEMEKLRTSKTVDLQLLKLDRDRNQLIVQVRLLSWSHNRLLKRVMKFLVKLSPLLLKFEFVLNGLGNFGALQNFKHL